MNKWVGERICDLFDGDDGLTRHHGHVTEILYHEIHLGRSVHNICIVVVVHMTKEMWQIIDDTDSM